MRKTWKLLTFAALLCLSLGIAACNGGSVGSADPVEDPAENVVIVLEAGTPSADLGKTGDVCLVAETGAFYRKTESGWEQTTYERYDADGSTLTVTYSDGSTGSYAMAASEETDCAHEGLAEAEYQTIYPAKCVIPGIGVKTCPACHESFPEILPATGEHRYEKNGYTCLDCNETDYFKDGQEVAGDEENPEGYFVVKNVPQVMIEDGSIEIPGHIHGLPVIIGSNAFTAAEKKALTSVILDEGIVKIEANAFNGCSNLTDISLPETLTEIGDSAFYKSGLTSLEIPASLEKIGVSAFADDFRGTRSLTSVTFAENGNLREIGASAFTQQRNLQGEIRIPASVETIGEQAFWWTGITKLVIEDGCSVTSLGLYAFASTDLTSVDLSKSQITEIGESAFNGSGDITDLQLPQTLKTIGKQAFRGLVNLEMLVIPASVETIGDEAFISNDSIGGSTGFTSVTIEEGSMLTSIGSGAFEFSKKITSFDFTPAKNLKELATRLFYNCTSLASVQLPAEIKTINDSLFAGCTALTDIQLPEGVETIKTSAFSRCTSLTEISIPSSVTEIEINAFKHSGFYEDSSNWTDIYAGETVKWKAFSVGDCLLEVKAVDGLAALQKRNADEKEYEIEEEYTLKLPEGTRVVASNLFRDTDLSSTSQDAVTQNSFYKLVIPYTVQYLSTAAFSYSIPPRAEFSPRYIYVFEIEDTEEHPSQLISIGSRAFLSALSIASYINIPDSVKHIGENALGMGTYSTLPYSLKYTGGSSPWYNYYTFHTEHVKISTENWRTADMTSEELQKDHPNTWEEGEISITQYFMDEERTKPVSEFWYCLYTGVELWRD